MIPVVGKWVVCLSGVCVLQIPIIGSGIHDDEVARKCGSHRAQSNSISQIRVVMRGGAVRGSSSIRVFLHDACSFPYNIHADLCQT